MSTFKQKPKKNNKKNEKDYSSTLDSKHTEITEKFQKERNNLDSYKTQLINLNSQLYELQNRKLSDISPNERKLKNDIQEKIKMLETKIYNIENNIDELDYYTDTIDILIDYYNILYNKPEPNKNNKPFNKNNTTSLLKYFVKDNNDSNINNKPTNNRATLFEKYQKIVEKKNSKNKSNDKKLCSACNIEKIITVNDGAFICPNCGELDNIIFENDKPTYKGSDQENITTYPYKRINHFQEILNQVQGRESTQVPDEVYDNILLELKKQRVSDLSVLNHKMMKAILKKLNYNRFYEHIPHIINKLSGLPPPNLTREIEEKFRQMFKMIQEPFALYCPKNGPNKRKNFLNYSYVLYKFCELLELDHLLICFPLLKNKEKLQEQDRIWKQICNHLGWQFIYSL